MTCKVKGVVMKRGLSMVVVLAWAALVARGATLVQLGLDEMIEKSTAIVRGQVSGSYAATHGSIIYTHYRVQVVERWKGPATAELDIVVPGGSAGGLRMTFPDSPKLTEGGEYVLFLWKGSSGLTNIIGWSQGIFDLKRDREGGTLAARPASRDTMLDAAGRLVKDEPVLMRLQDLRERISSGVVRGARK